MHSRSFVILEDPLKEIFLEVKGFLFAEGPQTQARLDAIMNIPLIEGNVERERGLKGWSIRNDWYMGNMGLANAFWGLVIKLCKEKGIRARSVGVSQGVRQGRTRYYRGWHFIHH